MGLLSRLFGGGANQEKASGVPEGFVAQSLQRSETFSPPDRSTTRILQNYGLSPLAFMVGQRISALVASQSWMLFTVPSSSPDGKRAEIRRKLLDLPHEKRRDFEHGLRKGPGQGEGPISVEGDLDHIDEHPFLDMMRKGNGAFVGYQIMALSQVYLDWVGECYLLMEFNKFGMPTSWSPIPPHLVEELPTREKPYYKVSTEQGTVRIPMEFMFAIRNLDPFRPFGRGLGHGKPLASALETERFAETYLRNYFRNNAKPDVIIAAPDMTANQAMQNQSRWLDKLRGVRNAHLPHFMALPAQGQIIELDTAWKHGGVAELKDHERDVVMQVFGLSPEVMGIVENSNRASVKESLKILAESVIIPRMEIWREALQHCVIPLFDEELILDYEDPRPEDRELKIRSQGRAPWALTINEHRKIIGEQPLRGEEGDYHPVPKGVQFVARLEDALIENLMPEELEPINEPENEEDEPPQPLGQSSYGKAMSFEDELDKLEDEYLPRFAAHFENMILDMREDYDETAIRDYLARNKGFFDDVLNLRTRVSNWVRDYLATAKDLAERALNAVSSRVRDQDDLAVGTYTDSALAERAERIAESVGEEVRDAIQDYIATKIRDGQYDPDVLAKDIKGLIGLNTQQIASLANKEAEWLRDGVSERDIRRMRAAEARKMIRNRAELIARTEASFAAHVGQHQALLKAVSAGALSKDVKREWRPRPTGVCPICEGMRGQKRALNERFKSTYNGSTHLHPPAHPKCRCVIVVMN